MLKHVSVGPQGELWGCNAAEEVWYRASVDSPWQKSDGALVYLEVASDGTVYGINNADQIWYKRDFNSSWQSIEGFLHTIGVGTGPIWGTYGYGIWFKSDINAPWQQIDGKLKQISVGHGGDVWGVKSKNKTYYRRFPEADSGI